MNSTCKKTGKDAKGFVLIMAIFAVVLMATMVIGLAGLATVES